MTLLGTCTEMLDLTNLLNFFCWVGLFEAKIVLLLLIVIQKSDNGNSFVIVNNQESRKKVIHEGRKVIDEE